MSDKINIQFTNAEIKIIKDCLVVCMLEEPNKSSLVKLANRLRDKRYKLE